MRVCRSDRCVLLKSQDSVAIVGETNAIEGARRGVVVDEIKGIMVFLVSSVTVVDDEVEGRSWKIFCFFCFFEAQAELKGIA